jgi:hypothetical protein
MRAREFLAEAQQRRDLKQLFESVAGSTTLEDVLGFIEEGLEEIQLNEAVNASTGTPDTKPAPGTYQFHQQRQRQRFGQKNPQPNKATPAAPSSGVDQKQAIVANAQKKILSTGGKAKQFIQQFKEIISKAGQSIDQAEHNINEDWEELVTKFTTKYPKLATLVKQASTIAQRNPRISKILFLLFEGVVGFGVATGVGTSAAGLIVTAAAAGVLTLGFKLLMGSEFGEALKEAGISALVAGSLADISDIVVDHAAEAGSTVGELLKQHHVLAHEIESFAHGGIESAMATAQSVIKSAGGGQLGVAGAYA